MEETKKPSAMETTTTTTTNDAELAERLRVEGNDAFSQENYEKAIQLYEESNKYMEQAKTYSNLAATLAKFDGTTVGGKDNNRMEEAIAAAEKATILDPSWGKGWWRYGMLLEMTFQFDKAKTQYENAVKAEPNEQSFQTALKTLERKLQSIHKQKGIGRVTAAAAGGGGGPNQQQRMQQSQQQRRGGGGPPTTMTPTIDRKEYLKRPGYKAWMEAVTVTGPGSSFKVLGKYAMLQNSSSKDSLFRNVTSRQYIVLGFTDWINGMKRAMAEFARSVSREADMACKSIIQQRSKFKSEEGFLLAFEEVLGGFPDRMSLFSLASGFSCLGGNFIFLETSVTPAALAAAKANNTPMTTPEEVPYMCPPRKFLENLSHYQHMSLLWSIDSVLTEIIQRHHYSGKTLQCSKAIIQGSMTLWSNMPGTTFRHNSIPYPEKHDPTPEQVVQYIKQQLRAGHTWNDSMNKFVSLQYRGTMLYAALLRWNGNIVPSFHFMKWAREFITLADKEFSVTSTKDYNQYGSAFKPSLRIGMMVAELITLQALRGNNIFGKYSMESSLDLCAEIIQMAELVDVSDQPNEYLLVQWDVAARRKPLSIAHATIAHHLNMLSGVYPDQLQQIVSHHGLIDKSIYGDDEECDPFAVCAHHYRIAADNELADSDNGASFWWAHAACMAQAKAESGYTLEKLQNAIERARAADAARDIDLFGPNVMRGGSFETIAKLTAEYFQNESNPSSFILPQVQIVSKEGEPTIVKIGDEIICKDFAEYQKSGGGVDQKIAAVDSKTMAASIPATTSNSTESNSYSTDEKDSTDAGQIDVMTDAMASFAFSLN